MTGDLHFFVADLIGFAVASALAVPLVLAPGALVARLLQRLSPRTEWRAFAPALSIAFLPIVIALATRGIGLRFALALDLVLVCAAIAWARAWLPRVSGLAAAGIAGWWLYLAAMYLDFDVAGALHQSITVLDLVKHAAVVREIADHGLPLNDPFFARAEAAGYYHYFYDLAAMIDVAGGTLVDARMAFCGAAFACGLAMAGLLRATVVELGWQRSGDGRLTGLVILACALGGLDLVGIAFRWGVFGVFERTPEWWDDEISFLPTTASWVPHHLASVIAAFIALLLMSKALAGPRKTGALLAGGAGAAMASGFGLSIWVSLGAAAIFALAVRFLEPRQRPAWIASAAVAGAVALALSIPQLLDLAHGRAVTGAPVGLWIREPARLGELVASPLNPLLWLALTPLVLAIEFGAFALGSYLFWKDRTFERDSDVFARLLLAGAVGGLLLNLLVRSTIINNDFGWRVAWFAAFPAMVWTVAALQRPIAGPALRAAMAVCIVLGLGCTASAVIVGRMPPGALPGSSMSYINAAPRTDLALREAYDWANRHLPANAVLQHNPAAARRAFAFGLYSDHRVRVADGDAELFGASAEAVDRRATFYGRIFAGEVPLPAAGPIHFVITDDDPVWRTLKGSQCIYRADHVCITGAARP